MSIQDHGKAAARLVPVDSGFDRAKAVQAAKTLLKIREGVTLGGLSVKELVCRRKMMPKIFEIEVEKMTGYCACGYKEGDVFTCEGLNTPDKAFCGGAYAILFPMQTALHSGASFHFEENPHSKTKLACPDNGYVIFKITLLPEQK